MRGRDGGAFDVFRGQNLLEYCMGWKIGNAFTFAALAATSFLVETSASAAPPASCAWKFVGTWAWAGGTGRLTADGKAYPTCAMCVAVMTWTCSGNTYIITSPVYATATLSPDGRTMSGSSGVSTRIGGAAIATSVQNTNPPKSQAVAPTQLPPTQAANANTGCPPVGNTNYSGISGSLGSNSLTPDSRNTTSSGPKLGDARPSSPQPGSPPCPPQVAANTPPAPNAAAVQKPSAQSSSNNPDPIFKGNLALSNLPDLSDSRPVGPPKATVPTKQKDDNGNQPSENENSNQSTQANTASSDGDGENEDYAKTCVKAFQQFQFENLEYVLDKKKLKEKILDVTEIKARILYYKKLYALTKDKLNKCKQALIAALGKLEPDMDKFFEDEDR